MSTNTQPNNPLRNPPAFPQRASDRRVAEYAPGWDDGMTLRDYFAGQALAGLCAAHANPSAIGYPDDDETATKAYRLADAMLRAREGKP